MQISKRKFDWYIFCSWLALSLFGVLTIYSASSLKIGETVHVDLYFFRQSVWLLIAGLAFYFVLKSPYPLIEAFVPPAYGLSILLLGLVFVFPPINGSHRWIPLGISNLQPSELAKITTILFTAKLLGKPHLANWQILLRGLLPVIIPVFLIIIEPDLGTSLVFWFVLFCMLAVSGLPLYYLIVIISPFISMLSSFTIWLFIILLLTFIVYLVKNSFSKTAIGFLIVLNVFFAFLTPLFWNSLKTYQQNRILTFIDPMRDPLGSGYQIIQAKIAIGSGGLVGKGYLNGTQKNLNFLPEHHTDFIFSVIGEEMGFLGCLLVLGLFFLLFSRIAWQIDNIAVAERKIAAVGLLAYLVFQMVINIGMNIGLVPTTGIPLPFISYGGTSLLINSLAVAIILKFLIERSFIK